MLSFYSADFAEAEYIDSLIQWENPLLVNTDVFEFSEAEKLAMINLPRVECKRSVHFMKGNQI